MNNILGVLVDRRLPTEAEQRQILLDKSAEGPCACGKRRCGDRQVVLNSKCKLEDCLGGIEGHRVRLDGRMLCQVCDQVHKLSQALYISDELAMEIVQ